MAEQHNGEITRDLGDDQFYHHVPDHIHPFHALLADTRTKRTGSVYPDRQALDEHLAAAGGLPDKSKG